MLILVREMIENLIDRMMMKYIENEWIEVSVSNNTHSHIFLKYVKYFEGEI